MNTEVEPIEERARIERERERAADAEARAKEEKRTSREAYRKKVHARAVAALVEGGLTGGAATLVVDLVSDGKVRHMQIVY